MNKWQWKDNKQPGPQVAKAGDRWQYNLQLEGEGDKPACRWESSFLSADNCIHSDDPFTLIVVIPADQKGIHKVHYSVSSEPPIEGFLLLKIIPSSSVSQEPVSPPEQEIINNKSEEVNKPADMETDVSEEKNESQKAIWKWAGGVSPGPQNTYSGERWQFRLPLKGSGQVPDCKWESDLWKQEELIFDSDHLSIAVDIPDNAAGIHKVQYTVGCDPVITGNFFLKILKRQDAPQQSTQLNPGNYSISIYRDGIVIPQLKTKIETNKNKNAARNIFAPFIQ